MAGPPIVENSAGQPIEATPVYAVSGVDSNGDALPAGFDNYTTVVDDSTPGTTIITSTGAAGTWVQTITTEGSVVTIPPPVKQ